MSDETTSNEADKLRESIDNLASKIRTADSAHKSQVPLSVAAPFANLFQGIHESLKNEGEKIRSVGSRASVYTAQIETNPLRREYNVAQAPEPSFGLRKDYAVASPPPAPLPPRPQRLVNELRAEDNFAAREARLKAFMAVRGGSPQSQTADGKGTGDTQNKDDKEVAKAAGSFGLLNSKMLAFAAVVGAATKGLDGTKEGYLLGYSIQHVFFEIADMLRTPIRLITREIEGFARVLHVVNATSTPKNGIPGLPVIPFVTTPFHQLNSIIQETTDQNEATEQNKQNLLANRSGLADVGARNHDEQRYQLGMRQMREESSRLADAIEKERGSLKIDIGNGGIGWHQDPNVQLKQQYDANIKRSEQLHADMAGKPAQNSPKQGAVGIANTPDGKPQQDPHLQPALTVSFGDVAGLQAQMQKLATENPAQEKGLSLIEQIAKAVFTIAYGDGVASKMFPDQGNPAVKPG